ncbi:unnamed protein product [Sympodiomycopsis kandeliae]
MPRDKSHIPYLRTESDWASPYQVPGYFQQQFASGSSSTPGGLPPSVVPTSPSVAITPSSGGPGWGAFAAHPLSPAEWHQRFAGPNQTAMSATAGPSQTSTGSSPGQGLRTSCRFCRTRKIKCPGGSPCQTCVSRGIACIYDGKSKMGRPPLARNNTKDRANTGSTSADQLLMSRQQLQQEQLHRTHSQSTLSSANSSPHQEIQAMPFAVTSPPPVYGEQHSFPFFDPHHSSRAQQQQQQQQQHVTSHPYQMDSYTPGHHRHVSQPQPTTHQMPSTFREVNSQQQSPVSFERTPMNLSASSSDPSMQAAASLFQSRADSSLPQTGASNPPDLTVGTTVSLFFFELFQSEEAWSVYATAVQAWKRDRAHLVSKDHPDAAQLPDVTSAEIYQGMMRWMAKDCVEGCVESMSRIEMPRSTRYAVRLAMDTTANMDLDDRLLRQSDAAIADLSRLSPASKRNLFQTWMDIHPCSGLLTEDQRYHLTRWENPLGWPAGWQALHLLVLGEALEWKSGISSQSESLVARAEAYFWQLKMGVSPRDDAFLTLIGALFAWHHLGHFRSKKGSVYLALACHLPNSGCLASADKYGNDVRLTHEETGKLSLIQTILNCQAIWTFMQLGTNDANLLRMMRFELERMWTGVREPSPSLYSEAPSNDKGQQRPIPLVGVAREIRNMTQTIILTARLQEMYLRSQTDWSADRVSRDLQPILRSQLKLSIAKAMPIETSVPFSPSVSADAGLHLFDQTLHNTLSLAFRFLIPISTFRLSKTQSVSILQDCLSLWTVIPKLSALASKQREKDTMEQFHLNPPSPKTAMQDEEGEEDKMQHEDDLYMLSTVTLVHIRMAINSLDRLADQRDIPEDEEEGCDNRGPSAPPAMAMSPPGSAPGSRPVSQIALPASFSQTMSNDVALLTSDTFTCLREGLTVLRRASPDRLLTYQRREVEALEREFVKLQERYAAFMPINVFSPSGGVTSLWPSPRGARSGTVSGNVSGAASNAGSNSGSSSGPFSSKSPAQYAAAAADRSMLLSLDKLPAANLNALGPRTSPATLTTVSPGAIPSWPPSDMEDISFDTSNNSVLSREANNVSLSGPNTDYSSTAAPEGSFNYSSAALVPFQASIFSADRKKSIVWDSFWGSLASLRSSWSASGSQSGPSSSAVLTPQMQLQSAPTQLPRGMVSTTASDVDSTDVDIDGVDHQLSDPFKRDVW